MRKLKCIMVFISMVAVLTGCGGSHSYVRPALKSSGLILTKSIEKKGEIGVPADRRTDFSPLDDEIVAYLSLNNFSGKYLLRWDWYNPAGNLYYSTGNFPLETAKGKYRKSVSVWHSLKIKDDPAADLPGRWMVKLFLNDELMDYKTFVIEDMKDPTALPETLKSDIQPADWGVIIGIEQYARLPQVPFARKDALVIEQYFQKVLGIPQENIIMLLDNNATKARIEGFIKNYLPKKVSRKTKLYIYFAGHGAPDIKAGAACLVPYDGDTRFLKTTSYQLKTLYADLDKLGVRRTYVFLDSCFSGVAARASDMLNKGTRPALIHVDDVAMKSDKLVAFSASSAGETSNAYEETRHGLFTYFLLKAIRGEADANADHELSVEEVYDYVSSQVSKAARRMGTEQNPNILPALEKIKDMSFSKIPRSG